MQGAAGAVTRGGARVEAGREASQLHSRGFHGTPQPGGALDLSWAEAAYLVEVGRLAVMERGAALSLGQILERGQAQDDRFETRYLVYRDLRERGFVVREEPPTAGVDFTVRERGGTAKAPSKYWVLAASERGEMRPAEVHDWADRAAGLGKVPLVAVVDEEGDLTYYEFGAGLEGPVPEAPGAVEPIDAVLVGDHVLVDGPRAQALHGPPWHFGKPLKLLLRLSLLEATWLFQRGALTVRGGTADGPPAGADALRGASAAQQPDFDLRLAAYAALRDRRLVPKTGFKYGVHFRVYASGEGRAHARFLVHAIEGRKVVAWPELSRAVRLSHGVRKQLAYGLVDAGGRVRFLRVRWTRP
ncbi:MAG TPA: tRNA-intron lyase [Candidatus Thermoplasmatota archaeon]